MTSILVMYVFLGRVGEIVSEDQKKAKPYVSRLCAAGSRRGTGWVCVEPGRGI